MFDKVKNALKQEKKNSNPKSDFEVYICHDEEDRTLAEDICNALEDNGIGCCLKARDLNGNDVGEVINAINCYISCCSDNFKGATHHKKIG